MCRATAGEDVNFSWDELASLDRRLKIYWNLHKFVMNLSVEVGQNPFEMDDTVTKSMMGYEEKYIMSRLQSTISEVSSRMEKYELDKVPLLIDELFLDLSRNYLQMVREKSSVGSQEDKEVVLYTLTKVLFEGLKMAQIVIPFVTEAMYLNLREAFDLEEESISHFLWRKVDESYLDLTVEKEMAVVFSVIQAGLHAREQAKLGLRWPIKELVVVSLDSDTILAVEKMRDLLKEQLKVKDISVLESLPGVDQRILPNPRKIGPKFAQNSSEVMTKLGRVDSNEVLEQLAKFGVYKFVLDSGEQVSVDRLDLLFERDVPKGYTEGEFESGFAYMNLERSDELLAEGYARELMRHVQNARKKVGFSKSERILLHVTCPEDLVSGVSSFSEAISAKVGASKIAVVAADFPRKFEHQKEVKVREQVFKLGFEKEKKEEV